MGYWGHTLVKGQEDREIYWRAETSNTEADARAKMLIYLVENKLISLL